MHYSRKSKFEWDLLFNPHAQTQQRGIVQIHPCSLTTSLINNLGKGSIYTCRCTLAPDALFGEHLIHIPDPADNVTLRADNEKSIEL